MQTASLIRVSISNFRSFAKAEVYLPTSPGLILLTGENKMEERLGANAAGKSSFWDAVEWSLHGSSVRGGRTAALISWGTDKTEVTTDWLIDDSIHSIRRYGPPTKVELDGKLVEQQEINNLIKLDKSRFLHSIIFGQNTPLFPDLSITERGELLDEVLSLNIWQKATNNAGNKCSTLETDLNEKKTALAFIKGKLDSVLTNKFIQQEIDRWEKERLDAFALLTKMKDMWEDQKQTNLKRNHNDSSKWQEDREGCIATLKKDEENWKSSIVAKAEEKINLIYSLEAELAPIKFEVENQQLTSPGLVAILTNQLKEVEDLRECTTKLLHSTLFELDKYDKASYIWKKDKCPVCSREITQEMKEHELACIEKVKEFSLRSKSACEIDIAKFDEKIYSFRTQLTNLHTTEAREQEKMKSKEREVTRIQSVIAVTEHEANKFVKEMEGENPFTTQITHLQKQVNPYIQQREKIDREINPYLSQIKSNTEAKNPFEDKLVRVQQEREKLTNEHTEAQNEYNKIEALIAAAHYWKHGFKRIRLYFVQQVLAALQVEIQSAITALGLEDWAVKLSTETITKSETVRLGVQINISSPVASAEWTVWSGGETQRLRRAIAMGLASLIQRAAGIFYTFEVHDEPTAGLSPQGVEDLLETFRYRAESLQKQVWVTDHSALTYAGFSEIWCAIKEVGGSKLVKLSESEG